MIPRRTALAVAAEREQHRTGKRGGVSPVALLDADMECAHGRLAGDRTPACGCWADER